MQEVRRIKPIILNILSYVLSSISEKRMSK